MRVAKPPMRRGLCAGIFGYCHWAIFIFGLVIKLHEMVLGQIYKRRLLLFSNILGSSSKKNHILDKCSAEFSDIFRELFWVKVSTLIISLGTEAGGLVEAEEAFLRVSFRRKESCSSFLEFREAPHYTNSALISPSYFF